MKRYLWIVLLSLLFITLPEVINRFSFFIADRLSHPLLFLDPNHRYMHISIHHLVQMVCALLLIALVIKITNLSWHDFGFRRKHFVAGLKMVVVFVLGWTLFQGLFGVWLITSGYVNVVNPIPDSPLSWIGYTMFQWLLSGTSEEVLYRSLPLTLLSLGYANHMSENKAIRLSIVITTLAFVVGHVGYSLNPLAITYFNPLQIATVIIFGIAYALVFLKTRNIFVVMIMHNVLNGVIVGLGVGFYWWFG